MKSVKYDPRIGKHCWEHLTFVMSRNAHNYIALES
jgi:hypothetical protein